MHFVSVLAIGAKGLFKPPLPQALCSLVVCPSVRCLLTPSLRDTISLYLVKGFH